MIYLKKIQPLILTILFVVGMGFVVVWVSANIEAFGDNLYNRIQTIADERVFEEKYRDMLKMVEDTDEERKILDQFVLHNEDDTIELLSKFDEIAPRHGVEIATKELDVIEKSGSFNDLSIGFKISGDEESVMKMIKMFETLPYHGHITSLSISRQFEESTSRVKIDADISVLLSIKKYD